MQRKHQGVLHLVCPGIHEVQVVYMPTAVKSVMMTGVVAWLEIALKVELAMVVEV